MATLFWLDCSIWCRSNSWHMFCVGDNRGWCWQRYMLHEFRVPREVIWEWQNNCHHPPNRWEFYWQFSIQSSKYCWKHVFLCVAPAPREFFCWNILFKISFEPLQDFCSVQIPSDLHRNLILLSLAPFNIFLLCK